MICYYVTPFRIKLLRRSNLFILIGIVNFLSAQSDFSIVGGINLANIQYYDSGERFIPLDLRKYGVFPAFGLRYDYHWSSNFGNSVYLMYSGKGTRGFLQPNDYARIDFISAQLSATYAPIRKNTRFRFEGGIGAEMLFNQTSAIAYSEYVRWDFPLILGIGYEFSTRIGTLIRWFESLTPLFKSNFFPYSTSDRLHAFQFCLTYNIKSYGL